MPGAAFFVAAALVAAALVAAALVATAFVATAGCLAPDRRRGRRQRRTEGSRLSLISETVQTDRVLAAIEPSLDAKGYEIVRILLRGSERPVLQVMIDNADGTVVTIDDCTAASRAISALLDVEDPISGAYELEVSSPGIDRPLTRPKDFERFAGLVARVELKAPVDGRRRFRGRLIGVDGDKVRLAGDEADEAEVALPLAGIMRAKLVLNDELLAATQRAQSNRG
jgi:ribosome maturation factor RimP